MRISAFLLFIGLLQIFASDSYSQTTRLSLSMSDATVQQVLEEIEAQSEFFILFNHQLVDVNRKVNIDVSNKRINGILAALFNDTDIEHFVMGRQIILSPKDILDEGVAKKQQAQDGIEVKGTIVDSDGNPIPGVNIIIKGTTQGAVSDADGKYTINVDDPNITLVFSFIGMLTQEVPVGNQTEINITMAQDAIGLGEVVAIGYGTREKQAMTGSVATVESDKLTLQSTGSVSQALQGMAPGVTVTNSNRPGSDAKIRIRGLGTINNNTPLWVIDGVFATGGINQLSPSEIESITVLKDAASTAIYGARGANGVILVTTLKGKRNQATKVDLNVRVGTMRNNQQYDMLDVDEFGEMLWLEYKNSGIEPNHPLYGSGPEPVVPRYLIPTGTSEADLSLYDVWTYPITEANAEGTDWYNEIYNPGTTQEYTLSVTGGSDNSNYGFGFGYLDEDGMVKQTGYERYNFRSNLAINVNEWLEVGENFGMSHTNHWGFQAEGGENDAFGQLLQLTAITPVYDVMGNWAPASRITGVTAQNNPVAELDRGKDITRKNLGLIGNAYAKATIFRGLEFKTLLGINFGNYAQRTPLEANPESYMARADHMLTEYSRVLRQLNWSNTLNYVTTINEKHTLDLLLGTEAITNTVNYFGATRTKYLFTTEDFYVLSAGEGEMSNYGSATDWATMSYFGRLHYELSNKYLVDATVRHDGSSRFGKENRWGTFPAFALGWRLSNEDFMSSTGNWLNYLKIRASWGQSGNDQIGNYNGFTTYISDRNRSFYPITGSNNEIVSGYESYSFGNPEAKWETTTTINFGFDAALFSFIDFGADIWQRNTVDMLYPKAVPLVYG
ncbi:MAG: SusC/RagA family TonB-linked outer membrane protein, partial [Bacteroidota bacterium]